MQFEMLDEPEEDHFQIETRSFSLIDEYYPLILGEITR